MYVCMSNLELMLGEVLQTKVSGWNRTHNTYTKSLAQYLLDYDGTLMINLICFFCVHVKI